MFIRFSRNVFWIMCIATVSAVAVLVTVGCSSVQDQTPTQTQTPTHQTPTPKHPHKPDKHTQNQTPTQTQTPEPMTAGAQDAMTADSQPLFPYSGRGPYPVGVRTVHLDYTSDDYVDVWYPADPEALSDSHTEKASVASYVDPRLLQTLPEEVADSFDTGQYRDAVPAEGSFPVIVDGHAVIQSNRAYSFITSHLASWGFVVVSVEYPSQQKKSFSSFLGVYLHGSIHGQHTDDIVDSLYAVKAVKGDTADTSRVGVIGHGYGTRTALSALALPQISTGVFWSSPRESAAWPNFTFPGGSEPVTLIGLGDDTLVPEESVRALYESLWGPRTYFVIEGAGANTMSDFCRRAWPHGDRMDAMSSQFDELDFLYTTEGCSADFIDPTLAQAVLKHAVTTHFLRELSGEDIKLEAGFADDTDAIIADNTEAIIADDTAAVISDFQRSPGGEAARPIDLSEPGSYPVNIVTLRLPGNGNASIELYYPGEPFYLRDVQRDSSSYEDLLPGIKRELLPDGFNEPMNPAAHSDGPFASERGLPLNMNLAYLQGMPLIVNLEHSHTYAHGTTRALNTHLASWGLAVAQLGQHTEFSGDAGDVDGHDERQSFDDALSYIRLIVEMIGSMGSEARIGRGEYDHSVGRVGVFGHAVGASTAAHALELENVDAALGLSPLDIAEACRNVCGGDDDALMLIVDAYDLHGENSDALAVVSAHRGPAWYLEFPETGFNSFVDVCNAYYNSAGLGDAASALNAEQLERELNGCTEAFQDPTLVQAAVRHLATAFFLSELADVDITPDAADIPWAHLSGGRLKADKSRTAG